MGLSKWDLAFLAFECLNVVFAQLLNEYRRRDMRIRCSCGNLEMLSARRGQNKSLTSVKACSWPSCTQTPRNLTGSQETRFNHFYVSVTMPPIHRWTAWNVLMWHPLVSLRGTTEHLCHNFKTLDFVNCCKLLLLHILNFNMICFWSDFYEGKWDFHFKVYKNKV